MTDLADPYLDADPVPAKDPAPSKPSRSSRSAAKNDDIAHAIRTALRIAALPDEDRAALAPMVNAKADDTEALALAVVTRGQAAAAPMQSVRDLAALDDMACVLEAVTIVTEDMPAFRAVWNLLASAGYLPARPATHAVKAAGELARAVKSLSSHQVADLTRPLDLIAA